jgi:tetratricopeptide (TPR) repeat protein
MARGRTAVRDSRYRDARDALEAALEVEGVHCEDDRLVAKLLLGPTLVQLGELDAAERIYASALADAERLGDTLGRSVAHGNRVLLWAARRDHERALADLAAARDLARRIGHAVPERTTTYNLAEYLYWHGDLAEAARLADASRALQHGLVGEALEDDILIARIAAARGDEATSRAALERASTTRRSCPTAIALLRDATLAYLDRDTRRLDGLAGAARDALVGEELTEVLAWRASARRAVGEPAGNPSDPGLQAWRFL